MILFNSIKKRFLVLLLSGSITAGYAQGFNYSISLDTSFNYTALSGASVLSQNTKWQPTYEVPTDFSDSLNASLQSVTVESNGFVVYNKKFNSAVMALKGFGCKLDSNAAWSQLSYLTTGIDGSKILKIEFKNVGQGDAPNELLSYQVWLRENGIFEIVIGPNTYEKNQGDTIIDTNQVVFVGLINRNMDAETNGLFISGTPQSPSSSPVNSEHPDFSYLRTVPKKGYKYTFTPNQN